MKKEIREKRASKVKTKSVKEHGYGLRTWAEYACIRWRIIANSVGEARSRKLTDLFISSAKQAPGPKDY